ncbi:unnamed protein product [Trichobilharzia szidati]|nr:unnamed protein product [Trichobilharzia szidati]
MQQYDMEISNEEIISEEVHSLFHDACKSGNIRLCRMLIETGRADVNLMDSVSYSMSYFYSTKNFILFMLYVTGVYNMVYGWDGEH